MQVCVGISKSNIVVAFLIVARLDEELRISQERIKNLNSISDSKVEK